MHTIRFLLLTTKEDSRILEKRFRMLWHIHNQTVKYAQKQLHKLMRDRAYIDARKERSALKEAGKTRGTVEDGSHEKTAPRIDKHHE